MRGRAFSRLMCHIGILLRAGRLCPPRTCATLGTIRGGTASAVGSSEARRFWRALPAYRTSSISPESTYQRKAFTSEYPIWR